MWKLAYVTRGQYGKILTFHYLRRCTMKSGLVNLMCCAMVIWEIHGSQEQKTLFLPICLAQKNNEIFQKKQKLGNKNQEKLTIGKVKIIDQIFCLRFWVFNKKWKLKELNSKRKISSDTFLFFHLI